MPEESYRWLPKKDILSFEELVTLTNAFVRAGVARIRLTGGEPLLRQAIEELIRQLKTINNLEEITLTTNGVLLGEKVEALWASGLDRITISLDTLKPTIYRQLNGRDDLIQVEKSIGQALKFYPHGLKINAVIIRGINDSEIATLLKYAQSINAEIRFIEYMDVGGATQWKDEKVFSKQDILSVVTEFFGPVTTLGDRGHAPAARFQLKDGTKFGIIPSMTEPFCGTCDRSRITADGLWHHCLYGEKGIPIRTMLRNRIDEETFISFIQHHWKKRTDKGAENRFRQNEHSLIPLATLKKDPHLEMHTRGG